MSLSLKSPDTILQEIASQADERVEPLAEGEDTGCCPVFAGTFWTAKQRAGHSLQEISYRACFKPQLPQFFIERLCPDGGVVFDPFMGRGTTVLEAALRGRCGIGADLNPIARSLVAARLDPPEWHEIEERLQAIDLFRPAEAPDELLVFYHPETLREIAALRAWLLQRRADGNEDRVDRWLCMVAMNRLTGHSRGFLSVYTLPPNQAVSLASQERINARRKQTPPRRELIPILLRKSRSLLRHCQGSSLRLLREWGPQAKLLEADAANPGTLPEASVDLVVTSPPFLNVVDYAGDNWLRGWFADVDTEALQLSVTSSLPAWEALMRRSLENLCRVVRPGGWIAFEVGEVRKGTVRLEESILRLASQTGLETTLLLINGGSFTKTAHCWGVVNNRGGTNTNRIALLRRPG